jgi:hypothetical protein
MRNPCWGFRPFEEVHSHRCIPHRSRAHRVRRDVLSGACIFGLTFSDGLVV